MQSTWYEHCLAVIAIGAFVTHASQYLSEPGSRWLEQKHWVMAFCLLALPLMMTRVTASRMLRSPAVVWWFGYAFLTVIWFVLSSQSELAWQEVRWRTLSMTLFLTVLIVFWQPGVTRTARKTLVAAVLLGVVFNIYELFVPMSFSTQTGRSAGLYMNPNTAAEALVLGMILSVTVLPHRYRAPFILVSGIGILITISRAGILAWVIAAAGLILLGRVALKAVVLSAFVGLIMSVLLILPKWDQILTSWERTGVMNADVMERMAWFTDPSGVSDNSSWERRYVAQQAWERIAENPFLGSGTGSFHHSYVLPHNQYLALMIDHGLIGALIVPSLILTLIWGARGESKRVAIVFGCSFMVLCFFSHSLLTYEYSLVLLSLVAAMTGTSVSDEIERTVVVEAGEPGTMQSLVSS